MAFLFQTVVALVLLIDPILSFTTISGTRRSTAPPISTIASLQDSSTTGNYPTHGRISLSPSSLSMARRRSNINFYDDEDGDDDYDDDYYDEREGKQDNSGDYYSSSSYYEEEEVNGNANSKGGPRRRDMQKRPTDNYYDEEEDVGAAGNNDDEDDENEMGGRDRGGYYQVSFNEDVDPSETEIDWEVCTASSSSDAGDGNPQALVLLPPAAVERPTAILHFVGGTFFGSNPKLWYRSLLESIVRSTSAAIVVTPIPVTLFKNPLQHVRLSQKLQASFQNAWFTVLEDEYGADVLQDIPLCGLGHSLGARLLTVLTTLNRNTPMKPERRRRGPSASSIPPYKSMCLISFTNYGANVGIPGVATLRKQSKKREQFNNKRNKNSRRSSRGNSYYDRFDDDEDYDPDEDWSELVEDLQETVNEQANRIQTALTPNSKDLEFVPSPDRLWKAIREDARFNVNTTLVVQFDDDPIDQSSQLAQALHATNSSDVRFARLRGNHLTPVSVTDDSPDENDKGARRRRRQSPQSGAAGRFGAVIEKTIKGNSKTRRDKISMRDLRLSIISYITDVVTK